ncbi:stressosome-associated protein Prli42 [Gemelliphila palaticanis]|uniref:Stressosome-associated protein Prli42 n=1 Tax=Gemelliphila palaticanis TaxID=81950 RepID=A0ABX2SYG5_9BACL|nr:stressosome-associated protein Prli42 [Gemella palaticanis]NYS47265.1 stressosome-associated protein Prli42 [Gemella palaticanis]
MNKTIFKIVIWIMIIAIIASGFIASIAMFF